MSKVQLSPHFGRMFNDLKSRVGRLERIAYALILKDINTTANQTLTITGNPTGGSLWLVYNGQETGAIAYDAGAISVKEALAILSNVPSPDDIACADGPLPSESVTITFQGALASVANTLSSGNGLSGGTSPTITVGPTSAQIDDAVFGASTDAQATDGLIITDKTNSLLLARVAGKWGSTALTIIN